MSKPTDIDYAALLKRSLQAHDQLKAKLAASEAARNEPIAIIGMSCRFSGATDPKSYWSLLRDGRDMITEVPADRWDVDAYYDPDPDVVGKSYTRWGSFLPDVRKFDADFFGISRREAMNLDPQQRLLLELTWEALEAAGVAPSSLAESQTAVHVGMSASDYAQLQADMNSLYGGSAYTASGFAHSMASGRLAYVLGLHGPATTVDTACSSSLVAAHLAVQDLRNGNAEVAIAGGVNLMLSPLGSILCSRARMMSFKGRCHSFDAAADGYVRGEGGGILVMKRLSDAQRDGDRIHAVIRGSAINQDGRSSGLTAPNGKAQQAVIRAALANAGLSPSDISYVEAHGTGTSLGDPIEMKALGEVFGQRPADDPLMVASCKTNVGHLEGAAGVAGLIKAVLALQNRALPKHLHLKTPNPMIPWDQYPLDVPRETTPWGTDETVLRAGVSSFGFSGTNAHMVLEQAPATPGVESVAECTATLLTLSAKNKAALKDIASAYADALGVSDAPRLGDFAAAAAIGRSHLAERLAVTAVDAADAAAKLRSFANGELEPGVSTGWAVSTGAPEVVFMFTGQGAQRFGMARELYESEPAFRATMDRCASILDPLLNRPLLSVIWGNPEEALLLDDTAFTQPALFAVEYALCELWRSWGVQPSAVLGHSVGEYVAACVANIFSLEDGLKLIAARGRLMSNLPRDGSMAAIFASEERVRSLIQGYEADISIAAVNGPDNTVISGRTEAVNKLLEMARSSGLDGAALKVSHAFHSPLMDPILPEFETIASTISYSAPTIRFVSNLSGTFQAEAPSARYWQQHLRGAVRFGDSLQTLYDDAYRVFVEIGPAPILIGMGQRCKLGDDAVWIGALRNKRRDRAALLDTLGQLYTRGLKPDWRGLFGADGSFNRHVDVPFYQFQREEYWIQAGTNSEAGRANLVTTRTKHPLLGGAVPSPLKIYQTELGLSLQPWLADHRILDFIPFPATGFLEVAMAAGREALGYDCSLRDLTIDEALMLPADGTVALQAIVSSEGAAYRVQIFSCNNAGAVDAWKLHVTGILDQKGDQAADIVTGLKFEPAADMKHEQAAEYYDRLAANGAMYGPSFRAITAVSRDQRRVLGELSLPETAAREADRYLMHPGLLDSCIQLIGAVLLDDEEKPTYLPVGIGSYELRSEGAIGGRCYVSVERSDDGSTLSSELTLIGADEKIIAHISGLQLRRVTQAGLGSVADAASDIQSTFDLAWEPLEIPAAQKASGHWLILADAGGLGDQVAAAIRKAGASASVIKQAMHFSDTAEGWSIDPADTAQWSKAMAAATERASQPISGVVSLWALDVAQAGNQLAEIENGHMRVLEPLLHSARAIGDLNARLWLVTRGSQAVEGTTPDLVQAPAWALAGVIAAEYPTLNSVRIDLDPTAKAGEAGLLLQTILGGGREDRIVLRRNNRYVARLRPFVSAVREPQAVRLEIPERGSLSNLALVSTPRVSPGPGEVEIRVYATGLNFRDVLNALGMYPGDPGPLGNECSGVVTAVGAGVTHLVVGDEVVSMTDRSFATWVVAPAELTVRKPPSISFAQASTLPVTFLTSDYALRDIGRIKPGDRVLIHAVTGGVGMAATQIALAAGAEVIGTASAGKRDLARSMGVHHVFDSRSLSFVEDVRRVTGGAGVDIVLNSLAGDFIPATLGLMAEGGRFVEIGKSDDWDADRVEKLYPGVAYTRLYLGEVTAVDPDAMRERLARILADCVRGTLRPLPQKLYSLEQAEAAFRFMGQGQHTGKIVLTQPRDVRIRGDATYAITGGLGGLGLVTARWMASEGARHIVLFGRKAPTDYAQSQIAELESAGVNVVVIQADVSDREHLSRAMLRIGSSMPPLRGVIHAAGIVDDGMLSELSMDRFATVMASKVRGARNLHDLTHDLSLDFFVMFSSGAALLGSPGQGNYAAANGFLDALAHAREAEGLPGLSINWGVWADVGMAAAVDEQHQRRWNVMGLVPIKPDAGMAMLRDAIFAADRAQIAAVPLYRSKIRKEAPPFYSEIAIGDKAAGSGGEASGDILQRIAGAKPDERTGILTEYLSAQLVKILALGSAHKFDPRRSIVEMGMDSLMAMELRNRLLGSLNVRVSVTDLLEGPSAQQLATSILGIISPASRTDASQDAEREVELL